MRKQRRHVNEKGAVLVEMAFTLPILALVFLSALDLGLIIREYQLLQNAAREGARYSSIQDPNATVAIIQRRVVDYCAQENIIINQADVAVNRTYPIPLPSGLTATGCEVTVNYNRQMLVLGAPFLPAGPVRLTGRSVFRRLY